MVTVQSHYFPTPNKSPGMGSRKLKKWVLQAGSGWINSEKKHHILRTCFDSNQLEITVQTRPNVKQVFVMMLEYLPLPSFLHGFAIHNLLGATLNC